MEILVIGLGPAGQRHVKTFKELGHSVTGFDISDSTRTAFSNIFPGIPCHGGNIKSFLGHLGTKKNGVFACVVSTPPISHVPIMQ